MNNTLRLLVALLLGLVIGWFVWSSAPSGESHSGMEAAMTGMTMALEGKTGDAFDVAFLDEMIVHHQGAIDMANMVLETSKRPELLKLANDIITAQTSEIKQMEAWRTAWFQ